MIPVCHWYPNSWSENFGDFSTFPILDAMGYDAAPFPSSDPGTRFLGCGSLIDVPWLAHRPEEKRIIWGSGIHCKMEQDVRNCEFHAVRGPLTRRACGLPDDMPMGDPVLLLPMLRERKFSGGGGVAYIPHWLQRWSVKTSPESLGADFLIDITHKREDFWAVWEKIQTADFVLTSSLHGAIVAETLGIPWSLCLVGKERVECALKWRDWIGYLGLPDKTPAAGGIREGRELWEGFYSGGKIRPLDPLIDALHRAAESSVSPCK